MSDHSYSSSSLIACVSSGQPGAALPRARPKRRFRLARAFGPVLLVFALLAPPRAFGAGATRVVGDMQGVSSVVPDHPQRIADLWFAHNEVVAMLGAADRIAVTADRPQDQPWLFALAPALANARFMRPGAADAEALLADHVDLAFISGSLTGAASLRQAGIPALDMSFQTVATLRRSIALTADILNDPRARDRAQDYLRLLDDELGAISRVTGAIPENSRPRVLHLASVVPLTADGAGTIIDEWITAAGGRNVAGGLNGVKRPVTLEQILAWDPDVIILQGGDHRLKDSTPPGWERLRAARSGRVVENPRGVFPWDRYGSEFVLQLRWAATLFHPTLFSQSALDARMSRFYIMFFDHQLTRDEADRMLRGAPPAAIPSPGPAPGASTGSVTGTP